MAAIALTACSGDLLLESYLHRHRDQLVQPGGPLDRPIRFVVVPGAVAKTIGEELKAVGLIQDARLFEAYVRANGLAGRLQAGTFVLNQRMSMVEIAAVLQRAQAASITVTIPEGWRLEQVADYLSATELIDGGEYRQLAGGTAPLPFPADAYPFLAGRPAGASLEGYLFPDTYEIPAAEPTAADLLRRQLDAFAAKVMPLYTAASRAPDLHTVLTVASIVEREAVVASERVRIAGVYLNRLQMGMKLEADPTVQYAMGYQPGSGQWWKTPVFLSEYSQVDSPYNTYLYPGLPPGPIASPGLASIQAVLVPEEHDFLYFVAEPDGSGRHVFARTFAEHLENVRRYQRQ